eukprot:m.871678 g.871678  ORF g.871678 m.871678 type:complete len:284 (-) comp23568_c0_seq54:2488-3339(-)
MTPGTRFLKRCPAFGTGFWAVIRSSQRRIDSCTRGGVQHWHGKSGLQHGISGATYRLTSFNPHIHDERVSLSAGLHSTIRSCLPKVAAEDSIPWEAAPHNGVRLLVEKCCSHITDNAADFRLSLQSSVDAWRIEGRGAVWLHLSVGNASLVASAHEAGFRLHHVLVDEIVLVKWLPTDRPSAVPEFATHQVGVAGFVLNTQDQVLVVRERAYGTLWKLPGGLADLGEDLPDTAQREVWEETGIQTAFESILGFRQQHALTYGRSDIYVVCLMRPHGTGVQLPR